MYKNRLTLDPRDARLLLLPRFDPSHAIPARDPGVPAAQLPAFLAAHNFVFATAFKNVQGQGFGDQNIADPLDLPHSERQSVPT
jgi:hypothetical protein